MKKNRYFWPRRFVPVTLSAVFAFACLASPLAAQDVTIMPPVLFNFPNASDQPDTPPTLDKIWNPEFPGELLKTAEPGYVIISQHVTEEGKCQNWHRAGSNAYYVESVTFQLSSLQYTPAQKDGKPIASSAWLGVIYNPDSASPKKPDSTPRLLKVAPIHATQKQLDAFPKGPHVIRGTIEIDTAGAAKNLKLETDAAFAQAVRPAIERSLARWQFAPARKNGQPVDATLTLGFALQGGTGIVPKVSPNSKLPEVIKREAPVYPASLKRSHMVGEVLLNFLVNRDGNVESPTVVRSNHPAFEQPAMDAVLKWKFKPGIKDGAPVITRMQLPISFVLPDSDDTKTAFTTPKPSKKQTAQMPEGLRYDVAPKARGVIYPVYPYELFRAGKEGSATVAALVTARGIVGQIAIIKASAPEFGQAALAACEYFEFDPGMLEGRPTDAVFAIELTFDSRSIFVTDADRDMLRLEKKSPEKIVGSKNLDAAPKPVVKREAVFPLAAKLENISKGEAVVEFLIDTEGKVRLPRIVSSTHPSFGYMAVQTVANWRFEPPKAQGKPVVTRARIPVGFSLGGRRGGGP